MLVMRVIVAVAAVAALAAVGVWLAVADRSDAEGQTSGSAPTDSSDDPDHAVEADGQLAAALADDAQTTPASLPAERARTIEQALNDRDPERIDEVVDLGDIDPAAIAAEAIPTGSELVIDDDTFQLYDPDGPKLAEGDPDVDDPPDHPRTGLVVARIVGDELAEMLLVLTEADDGQWLLSGSTEPQPVGR